MKRRITLMATLAALMAPVAASAATFDVDTTADTNNAAGCTVGNPCSLREAVIAGGLEPGCVRHDQPSCRDLRADAR